MPKPEDDRTQQLTGRQAAVLADLLDQLATGDADARAVDAARLQAEVLRRRASQAATEGVERAQASFAGVERRNGGLS